MMLLRVVVGDQAYWFWLEPVLAGDQGRNRRTREHDAHLLAETLDRNESIGRDPAGQPLEFRAILFLTIDLPSDPADWMRQGIAKNPR